MEKRVYCISGSRKGVDEGFVRSHLLMHLGTHPPDSRAERVVVGDAKGVDQYAITFLEKFGFAHDVFIADWDAYGKAAGPIRNAQMVEQANVLLAFWDGKSRGTRDAIDQAIQHRIETHVYIRR